MPATSDRSYTPSSPPFFLPAPKHVSYTSATNGAASEGRYQLLLGPLAKATRHSFFWISSPLLLQWERPVLAYLLEEGKRRGERRVEKISDGEWWQWLGDKSCTLLTHSTSISSRKHLGFSHVVVMRPARYASMPTRQLS